jgi:acyl-CoA hydrolase
MRELSADLLQRLTETLPAVPRVVMGGNAAVPWQLLDLLDRALPEYRLFMLNAPRGVPCRPGVVLETPFVGPGMRGQAGLAYFPSRLSQVPHLFAGPLPPDVVCLHTTPPAGGKVSLGIEVNILPAAIEAAREHGALVLAQTNASMPYTYGDAEIEVSQLDAVLPVDVPLTAVGAGGATATDDLPEALQRLGRIVSNRVPDGAVLQLGIGRVPDAVLPGLLQRRGLGVWSEMVSDGVLSLDGAGALAPDRPLVTSFLVGSAQLYAWADRQERLRLARTETTNDPALIARNVSMVSINTALQVDLFGQANASRIRGRIHSGFGGQTDFIEGALHAPGGQALMALQSWHPRADVSAIIPLIDEPVTSFQHSAVITEHGVAEIWGHDERSQADQLIRRAAHPSVREELWEEARALGLA